MSEYQTALIREFSDAVAKRIADAAMSYLIKSKHTLSGDDSGLTNTWEEICVQVQGEHSYDWWAYEAMMHDAVIASMVALAQHEMGAIWLQTVPGNEWHERDVDAELDALLYRVGAKDWSIPANEEDSVQYIISQYLEPLAFDYTNANISAFLNPDDVEWDDEDFDDDESER